MASFEVLSALRDLDRRTPEYFRREVWAHGDLTTRKTALEILSRPYGGTGASRAFRAMISVVPHTEKP